MSEATAVARAASEVESLFCKGRGAEKFNVESSLQIELSFEGSHMLPFGLRVGAKSSSATVPIFAPQQQMGRNTKSNF